MVYFAILVSDCRLMVDAPNFRVAVVQEHALGTNDCRGWVRESVYRKLKIGTNRFCQFRLAFDAHGALWFNDFGLNLFGSIPASSLGGTGEVDVQPGVRVTIGVSAVIENFAFDEQGGLWTAGAQGRLLRLSADQLLTSGTPVPERVITSNDIGSLSGVAVYPAPAELPLFHALP